MGNNLTAEERDAARLRKIKSSIGRWSSHFETRLPIRQKAIISKSTFNTDPLRSTLTTENNDAAHALPRSLKPNNQRWTSSATGQEKCYDPNDTTLTLFDGEDQMDFELNDYKSLRAKMSCGHTVTPMSLTNWCRKSLDKGETKFVCGHCDVEWPYNEVYKMALLTPEEIKYFEKTLFKTAATDFWNAKKCPGCKSCVVRNDLNNARVCCTVCSTNKRRIYEFCWRCLKEWTRPSPYSDRCADPDCVTPEETLRTCPEITFKDVKNVTGCPSVRACPTCGLLIEHNKKNCKYITCLRCKEKFCFVCLKLNKVCDKYYGPCISGVAPRQTTIPVWKRK